MTIRVKTILVLTTVFLALLVALSFCASNLFLSSYKDLQKKQAETSVAHAKKHIDEKREYLENCAREWSEIARAASAENIIPSFKCPHADLTIMSLDNITQGSLEEKVISSIQESILGSDRESASAIVTVDGKPCIVCVSRFQNEQSVVLAEFLGAEKKKEMARELGMNIQIVPESRLTTEKQKTIAASIKMTGQPVTVPSPDDKTISAYLGLTDFSGGPSGLVRITIPQQILAAGHLTMQRFIAAFTIIGIIFIAVAILLVEKGLLKRLHKVSVELQSIGSCRNISSRLSLETSSPHDEFDRLRDAANMMLENLEEAHVQSAQQLAASEHRYKSLFNGSPNMIALFDSRGKCMSINIAGLETLQWNEEDVLGADFISLWPDDSQPFVQNALALVYEGVSCCFESDCLRADGENTSWYVVLNPLSDVDGTPGGFAAIGANITERKMAEEALQLTQFSVDSAADAVFWLDGDGNIEYVNRVASEQLMYESDELKQMKITDIMPEYTPDKWELFWKLNGDRDKLEIESRMRRHDETEFPVEVRASQITYGEKWLLVAYVRDITDRKHAEEELRAAHQQMELVVTSISSVLVGLNGKREIAQWNTEAERIFGVPASEVVGRPFLDTNIRWDAATIVDGISRCVTNNEPVRLADVRFESPDGSDGWLAVDLNAMKSDGDNPPGILMLATDISELKRMQTQLSQAQKMESIGHLAAGIAHEINTPTQYVRDNCKFLKESFEDVMTLVEQYEKLLESARAGNVTADVIQATEEAIEDADLEYLTEEVPQAAEQSLEGIAHVSRIVRAMKEFSHPGVCEKTPVNINEAIENTVTVARNEWKYVADVETDFADDLPLVPCMPSEMGQVILNLVVNAAHAIEGAVDTNAGEKGTIRISTRKVDSGVEIRVADSGTGIPEEIRTKVFDPFFTTKDVGKGTGQGLAIAFSTVVEEHGGNITFESETGEGTTFIVVLPVETACGNEAEAA